MDEQDTDGGSSVRTPARAVKREQHQVIAFPFCEAIKIHKAHACAPRSIRVEYSNNGDSSREGLVSMYVQFNGLMECKLFDSIGMPAIALAPISVHMSRLVALLPSYQLLE